ncbi:hypothetical protein [Bradyrhizobium sp. 151]|uniref:hypothetical protein n=1 Tax=Bradyrhizobium sp. 151 TaxID=2782626 RepID=UPI001FF9BD4A|nr:hypothetical protein [Bradyrhizobium sp. 151]
MKASRASTFDRPQALAPNGQRMELPGSTMSESSSLSSLTPLRARSIASGAPMAPVPMTQTFLADRSDACGALEAKSEMRIPIYFGRVFRLEAGHRSDLKPATIPK